MIPPHRCGNCKWGKFPMTEHVPPRPKANAFGECTFEIKPLLNELFSKIPAVFSYGSRWKTAMDAFGCTTTWPDEGHGCPTWEAKP